MLNRVQATGGSTSDLQKFYTALYHVLINPNIASDVNGQYRGFDNAIHTASHTVYQNYSGWDIYRSWAALIALIAPNEASDIAKSMVLDGQQGGLLPKWSHNHNEHFVMTGDPGPIIVASMYAFGARSFDTAAALTLMNASSNGGTTQGSPIRGRQAGYVQRQYIHEDPSDSRGVLGLRLRHRQVRPGAGQHGAVQHLHHPRPVVAQRVQHRVAVHPRPQRRRHLAVAARPGEPERLHRGQRVPVHLDGHLQLRSR